jgi:hypothetical protein
MTRTIDINAILALPMNDAGSKYGADMGRSNQTEGTPERLHLQRLRFVDGDYDTGGAYWGGNSKAGCIYCAFSPEDTENEFPIRVFVRAIDRQEAKEKVLALLSGEGWSFFGGGETQIGVHKIVFQPYLKNRGPLFELKVWPLPTRGDNGKWNVGYELFLVDDGKRSLLFRGEDFSHSHPKPLAEEAIGDLMSFLTMRPGDTDEDYFEGYTPQQLEYCDKWAEALYGEVENRFWREEEAA